MTQGRAALVALMAGAALAGCGTQGCADGGTDRCDVVELEWFDHEQRAVDVVEHDHHTHDHGAGDEGGESPPSSG